VRQLDGRIILELKNWQAICFDFGVASSFESSDPPVGSSVVDIELSFPMAVLFADQLPLFASAGSSNQPIVLPRSQIGNDKWAQRHNSRIRCVGKCMAPRRFRYYSDRRCRTLACKLIEMWKRLTGRRSMRMHFDA